MLATRRQLCRHLEAVAQLDAHDHYVAQILPRSGQVTLPAAIAGRSRLALLPRRLDRGVTKAAARQEADRADLRDLCSRRTAMCPAMTAAESLVIFCARSGIKATFFRRAAKWMETVSRARAFSAADRRSSVRGGKRMACGISTRRTPNDAAALGRGDRAHRGRLCPGPEPRLRPRASAWLVPSPVPPASSLSR